MDDQISSQDGQLTFSHNPIKITTKLQTTITEKYQKLS